jgi:cholesterol oxidase
MSNEHFDAVIIGSGFGGSVMTYRLAEAGMKVCLLERGKAYPPNSFARAPYDLSRNFWDPSKGLYGMFNVWSFRDSGALVSSGLGGGSLIYANILLRKDEKWFQETLPGGGYKPWPVSYKELESHYGRVEVMMNAQEYPLKHEPYKQTPKTLAMQEADRKLKLDDNSTHQWMPLNLAVSFRSKAVEHPTQDAPDNPPLVGVPIQEKYENYHKKPRLTCRLCGECDIGCNYGSKNTLDYTYISAAIHQRPHPAEVRTLCEVKSFEPRRDGSKGYAVTYIKHDPALYEGKRIKPSEVCEKRTITCDRLILAAGTFGTPYLLMKNAASFPNLSQKLGSRFCVNGDLLSFVIKSMEQKNGQSVPRRIDPSFGPVITSAIRLGDTLDGVGNQGRGFYVEDGGQPYFLSWLSEVSGFPSFIRRTIKFLKIIAKYRIGLWNDAELSAEVSELIGPANSSKSSFPVLTMGRDIPNGNLRLKKGNLECDWSIKMSQQYYDRVRRTVRAIARALNGEYLDNPSYAWNFHKILTAHPLGGSPMGLNREEGVVDPYGEVFGHPGLYVADGSMMPGPVGPNPSLTIAALSDRIADGIIDKQKGVRQ